MLAEVQRVGLHILRRREKEIQNGMLDGKHWFIAVVGQAVKEIETKKAA